MVRELGRILDSQGVPLSNRVLRYSACDSQADLELLDGTMFQPFYTLGDQLFVEPQPHAVPDAFDLERPMMSRGRSPSLVHTLAFGKQSRSPTHATA
jgi:hypothetical protein